MLEMHQVVVMVLDLERSKRPRDNPIPHPKPIEEIECDRTTKPYSQWQDHCYPLADNSEPGWSLKEIFGRPISRSCDPDGSTSTDIPIVWLNVPQERSVALLSTDRTELHPEHLIGDHRTFSLPSSGRDFDLVLPKQQIPHPLRLSSPPVQAARSITGYGQERGGLQTTITNPNDETLEIVYLESLPWFMKLFLHTLKASVLPSNGTAALRERSPIKETYYKPGRDRLRGTHLELTISIPAHSTVTVSYQFQKSLLRYTEYPPDANRGFDVPGAVIRILSQTPATGDSRSVISADQGTYMRTTPLLLTLPTPDFSMPYNVIILTSTVMALGFGGFFNMVVRRMVGRHEAPPSLLVLRMLQLKNMLEPWITASRNVLRSRLSRKAEDKKE